MRTWMMLSMGVVVAAGCSHAPQLIPPANTTPAPSALTQNNVGEKSGGPRIKVVKGAAQATPQANSASAGNRVTK